MIPNVQAKRHTDGNLRWRERRSLFRKPDDQIRTSDYDVAAVEYGLAKAFVLFHRGNLAGVAV